MVVKPIILALGRPKQKTQKSLVGLSYTASSRSTGADCLTKGRPSQYKDLHFRLRLFASTEKQAFCVESVLNSTGYRSFFADLARRAHEHQQEIRSD